MAQAITSHSSFARFNGEGVLARVAAHFAARRRYLATRRELAALSDRDLADLGINRGNIAEVAKDAAWNI